MIGFVHRAQSVFKCEIYMFVETHLGVCSVRAMAALYVYVCSLALPLPTFYQLQ